jgi:hypothetical protein
MVTPLLDEDTLDIAGLEKLVNHLIEGGVNGIFILGTTGEGPSLGCSLRDEFRTPYSSQSKLAEIFKTILKSVPGNMVSVWFNSSASSAAA